MKDLVLNTIDDLVKELLYYGRKEDEKLPVGAIDELVKNNEITVDEMSKRFNKTLSNTLDRIQSSMESRKND